MTPVEIQKALAEPFDPSEVDWKAQTVKGNRCLAVAYIDARAVMDRLDAVLGLGGWQTHYREAPNGVVCRLAVRIAGEWSEQEDAGSFSDQPDDGDKLKAAFSDALKRAAVHIGIGRYLYSLPRQWVDYDPVKKQIARPPTLPAWAVPGRGRKAAPAVKQPATGKEEARAPAQPQESKLIQRLKAREAELVEAGLCSEGELLEHVTAAGYEHDAPELEVWAGEWITFAGQQVAEFEAGALDAVKASGSRQKVTAGQIGYLARRLAVKGRRWEVHTDVAKLVGCKDNSPIEELSVSQWAFAALVVAKLAPAAEVEEKKA